MAKEKLAPLVFFATALIGQNSPLSPAAQKLLNHPRSGSAEITLKDGRSEMGRVIRVTDQFVAFENKAQPGMCEQIELPNISAVRWLPVPGAGSSVGNAAGIALLGAVLTPVYTAAAIADPFQRMSPPLNPLTGSWKTEKSSGGALESGFVFKSHNGVEYRKITTRRGHWSVERDVLRLMFDGAPEVRTTFRFDCGQMVLESYGGKYIDVAVRKPARSPLIGSWSGRAFLNLKSDGSVVEEAHESRKGTFENTATEVKIRWSNPAAPGDEEWVGEIKNRHLVFRIGGVFRKYHYVPPGPILGL